MGNSLCRPSLDCFNQCLRKRYDRWNSTVEFNPLRTTVAENRDNVRRSRIAEYIAWALHRSRSPLLLDDALSSTPVDSHPHDLNGPNSVSWMSDAASSDASHLLYREMDPYNQAAFVGLENRASPSSSHFDPSDGGKEGGWVAVTNVSDAKHGTSTKAVYLPNTAPYSLITQPANRPLTDSVPPAVCDEEVDGPELARLARSLWPRSTSRKKSANASSTSKQRPSSVVIPSNVNVNKTIGHTASEFPPFQRTNPITRPSHLNLRITPSAVPIDPMDLFGSSTTQVDSPIELDWDHEPGTMSPQVSRKASLRRSRLTEPANNNVACDSGFEQADFDANDGRQFTETNLFPVRPRRRPPNSSRPVAVLPLTGSPSQFQKVCKKLSATNEASDSATQSTPVKRMTSRWANSEVLVPENPRMNPMATTTTIPHSNLLVSPSTYLPDTLLSGNPQAPTSHELVDSGFVGFSGSCADYESDNGAHRLADFLWEHEVFESPHSPRLTSTPYS